MAEEKVYQDELAEDQKALVPAFETIRDLADKPAEEKIAALRLVTSYVGAETASIDDYLGVILEVVGCVVHPATVSDESGNVTEADRVVFKLKEGKNIGFVSKAAADFAKDYLFPLFGQGDFLDKGQPVVVPIVVRQIRTRKGFRTYSFQVV